MATATVLWYGLSPKQFLAKKVDWTADTIKVSLHTVSYVPNQDTDDFFNDTSNEVTGTAYVAGGQTLTTPTITYTSGTNVMALNGDDMVWSTSTIANARVAVIYDSTPGTAATNPLLGYAIFNADVSTSAGTLTIVWDNTANALLTLTAA